VKGQKIRHPNNPHFENVEAKIGALVGVLVGALVGGFVGALVGTFCRASLFDTNNINACVVAIRFVRQSIHVGIAIQRSNDPLDSCWGIVVRNNGIRWSISLVKLQLDESQYSPTESCS